MHGNDGSYHLGVRRDNVIGTRYWVKPHDIANVPPFLTYKNNNVIYGSTSHVSGL